MKFNISLVYCQANWFKVIYIKLNSLAETIN